MLLPALFDEEIAIIQTRHALMFPKAQLKFIEVGHSNGEYELKFLEGYDLSTVITMEIQLAFKLVFAKI